MRWAAIDFETATANRASACALGVVVVENGRELHREHWLIRPPGNEYYYRNSEIHGIHPGHTEHAPSFRKVWDEALELIGDRSVIAHNAPFDVGVVRGCCEACQVDPPDLRYFCTVTLARRAWPNLSAHKLPIVAQHLGVSLMHHDALSDAAACSQIFQACLMQAGASSVDELTELWALRDRRILQPYTRT